jgi:hypothetical protein
MKPKLTTSLLYLISYLTLTGFSFGGFVDDMRFKGTSVGVTKCVERNKQEGVPHSLIKRRCVNENQKKLENDVVTGSSGYSLISTSRFISKFIGSWKQEDYTKYCVNKKVSSGEWILELENYGCKKHTWTGKSRFSGEVKNKTDDKIITQFEIHINHEDNPDTEKLLFDVWILPNKSSKFKETDLVFQPKPDRVGEGDYTWSIQEVKGVDFILK